MDSMFGEVDGGGLVAACSLLSGGGFGFGICFVLMVRSSFRTERKCFVVIHSSRAWYLLYVVHLRRIRCSVE